MTQADTILREQLVNLLDGGHAHQTFDQTVADFPLARINTRPPRVSYSFWHLLEHIRIAQWDILDFINNPDYVTPKWPQDYWPAHDQEADAAQWEQTINAIRADTAALKAIVEDPTIDLASELPYAPGYTYVREILLVADHNAYHIGEFAILRQVTATWPPNRRE